MSLSLRVFLLLVFPLMLAACGNSRTAPLIAFGDYHPRGQERAEPSLEEKKAADAQQQSSGQTFSHGNCVPGNALPVGVSRPAGGWYPWFANKANMARNEFIRSLDGNGSIRLSVDAYVEDLKKLCMPVYDRASLKAFLASPDVEEHACTSAILAGYTMGRTDRSGQVRDYGFHRTKCYNGEKLLFHRPTGLYVLSLGCGNVMKPIALSPKKQAIPPVTSNLPSLICLGKPEELVS